MAAAKEGLEKYGFGLSSVRFICGTQTIHRKLENRLSSFFQTEDSILYSSCFDANGGLFETLLGAEDAIISDSLNHASINDLLIKINTTAICGTDLHIYNWDEWAQNTILVPMITGHEFAGVVVEKGGEVEGFSMGDRVTGEGHITCGHCRNCRAGKRHKERCSL